MQVDPAIAEDIAGSAVDSVEVAMKLEDLEGFMCDDSYGTITDGAVTAEDVFGGKSSPTLEDCALMEEVNAP